MGSRILILFDDRGRAINQLAQAIHDGAARVTGADVTLAPIDRATKKALIDTDALILGSPNWSGITGRLKLWLDDLGDPWQEGWLLNKIGAAFTTGTSRSAGIEFTLLSLIHWMLAGGMVVVGLPWSDRMMTTGSYYGPTATRTVGEDDLAQGRLLGQRVAELSGRWRGGLASDTSGPGA